MLFFPLLNGPSSLVAFLLDTAQRQKGKEVGEENDGIFPSSKEKILGSYDFLLGFSFLQRSSQHTSHPFR